MLQDQSLIKFGQKCIGPQNFLDDTAMISTIFQTCDFPFQTIPFSFETVTTIFFYPTKNGVFVFNFASSAKSFSGAYNDK